MKWLGLFRPKVTELVTQLEPEQVLECLRARARTYGNEFWINSKTFSIYRGSKVKGNVQKSERGTVVKFVVYSSPDDRAFFVFLIITLPVLMAILALKMVAHAVDFDAAITVVASIAIWAFFFALLRGLIRYSRYSQEQSIRALIA